MVVMLASNWPDFLRVIGAGRFRPWTHNFVVPLCAPSLVLLAYSIVASHPQWIGYQVPRAGGLTVMVVAASVTHVFFDCLASTCYPFWPSSFVMKYIPFNTPAEQVLEQVCYLMFLIVFWKSGDAYATWNSLTKNHTVPQLWTSPAPHSNGSSTAARGKLFYACVMAVFAAAGTVFALVVIQLAFFLRSGLAKHGWAGQTATGILPNEALFALLFVVHMSLLLCVSVEATASVFDSRFLVPL